MIKVSIHPHVEHKDIADKLAVLLENWKNGENLPAIFGDEGRWEEHPSLCSSFVYKIHIKPPSDIPWNEKIPIAERKSDSYLVYTKHWLDEERYQIISIMSPNAHALAKTSFLSILVDRAESFQNS